MCRWTLTIPTQFSRSVMSDSLWTRGLQHARIPCPSSIPRACSNSCPLRQWWRPTVSSSVVPFSACLQSFPASGSFPMSQFITSGGQNIGVSASASVLSMTIQHWFPLGWTGWIFLQSKGLSRIFSSTTVQKHQFFGALLSPSHWPCVSASLSILPSRSHRQKRGCVTRWLKASVLIYTKLSYSTRLNASIATFIKWVK